MEHTQRCRRPIRVGTLEEEQREGETRDDLSYDEEIDAINSYLTVPEWLKFPDALATTQSWPFDRVEKEKEKPSANKNQVTGKTGVCYKSC